MNVDEYRKKVARQVDKAAKQASGAAEVFRDESKSAKARAQALAEIGQLHEPADLDRAVAIAKDREQPAELRAAAIGHLAPLLAKRSKLIEFLIERLGDREEATEVRGAVARALKSASFHVRELSDHHAAYINALRSAIDVDDSTLRARVLGVLARAKDAKTLRRLEEGLRDPGAALVDAEKALQLLSYDNKRDNRDLLLAITKDPPSPGARYQALRNLAVDPTCKPMFTKLVRNKDEDREARLIAMSALHAMDPDGLDKLAHDLASDDAEDEELRGACLTAMATMHPETTTPALRDAATSLARDGRSRAARDAAKLYLSKPSE